MTAGPWRPTPEHLSFIRRYSKAVEAGEAAIFAGAGLSRAAGFVDWRGLLREVADDLQLDIDKEPDLVALAQYYYNTRGNRNLLSQAIMEQFMKQASVTPNHYLLARLPIQTFWTTNYDQLIEQAFTEAGKRVDIKLTRGNLTVNRPGRDLVLYKMHGDVSQPQDAVLTKDDYETYEREHPLFVELLKSDLVGKTFLFLGFSFTDPNIEYILSRVRVLMGKEQRQHYVIMREPGAGDSEELRRTELRKNDLRRFGIETIVIRDFAEVEHLLEAISMFANRKNIFVSGSSRESGAPKDRDEELARLLGKRLIEKGYNLVSGFGAGIGEQCVLGAFRALYSINEPKDRVIVRPFPTALVEEAAQRELNTHTREDLVSRAGAAVFIAGNRLDAQGNVCPSSGVRQEFEIAMRMKRFIIPVAATGHVAQDIWNEAMANPGGFYPGLDVRQHLQDLADTGRTVDQLVDTILAMIEIQVNSRMS